jgi:pectinesterase
MLLTRRKNLQFLLTIPILSKASGCATQHYQATSAHAVAIHDLDVESTLDAIVGSTSATYPSGGRHTPKVFATISEAIDFAPNEATNPWRIGIREGRYYEKIEITKPNIHLIGLSRSRTFLTYDAYAGQRRPRSTSTWTTFGCATLIVRAPGFHARNFTIENGFDYLSNDAKSPSDPSYTNAPQAVALMLAKGSDRAYVKNVSIVGYQDTLFVDAGRSMFTGCSISGNVDFIFGAGQAYFDQCEIVSRTRRKPSVSPHGYVTAPSTQIADPYGLVFSRCRLVRESTLVPQQSHALGRPWHPAVNFPDGRYADPNAIGSCAFLNCFMDDHIHPAGWWSMTGLQKSGPQRTVFLPEDSRFFEYRSYGPGATVASHIRRQLSDPEAARYTPARVLSGWAPS